MHDRPFPFARPVASIAAVTEPEAFAALIERHRGELHRHCAWLYRIATNACFDLRARRDPALVSLDDDPVEAAAPPEQRPDAIVLAQETIDLTLRAAIRHLPPRQQAVLVMRDVLSWSARDAATALSTSVPATNSALQRARATLRARYVAGAA
jgi:RNA polymerase sigma-70 factor, ECF subfamily